MERELTLSGRVYAENWANYDRIILAQEDGSLIDLGGRILELWKSMEGPNNEISFSFYSSSKPCTEEEAQMAVLNKIYGRLLFEFNAMDASYSDYTANINYRTDFQVGNHDLFGILSKEEGRYLIVKVKVYTKS